MSDVRTISVPDAASLSSFAEDIRYYLSLHPRQLPSKYLYDPLGSALFEAITHLPWYSLTRAEGRLLAAHADELFDAIDDLSTIVELGPGSGEKLSTLMCGRAAPGRAIEVHLIDISPSALALAAATLSVLDRISVVEHRGTYESGLDRVKSERQGSGRTLVLFLGSNIGNFDRPGCEAFLRHLRCALRSGDALLLGTDLVKPKRDLLLAYDDPLGVTAAFNRNLLLRLNRELGADFDMTSFRHRAVWNEEHSRVEMHLVSGRSENIRIPAARFEFQIAGGETIWTESSYKYHPSDVLALLERNGFKTRAQWIDGSDPFALTLAEVD